MAAIAKNFDTDAIDASAVGGLVLYAPKGTAAPADASADWPTGWTSIGLITDDGVNIAYSKDTEEKMAWNVRGVTKRIPKSATLELKFTAMQSNKDTHRLYFGSLPTALTTAGHTRTDIKASSDVTEFAYGVEIPNTDGEVERYIIPRGVVTDLGDITYSETDLKQFEMTVAAQISPGVDYLAYILSNATSITVAS